ncbi:MAG: phosphopantetheine-binding protein [Lachnospira sp.]|jgi:acyl carrier protein|nr:phosphopantetheine-binding protein [Lachnospira sp.]
MERDALNVKDLLYEVTEDKRVYRDDTELLDSGILDSLAFMELFTRLEDYGVEIYPTRIDRERLRTVKSVEELVREYGG